MAQELSMLQCEEISGFFSDWEIIRKFRFKLISSEKEFSNLLGENCVSTFSNENVDLKIRYYPKKDSLNEVVGLSVVNLKSEGSGDSFSLQSYICTIRKEPYPSIDEYREIDDLGARLGLHLKDLEKFFHDQQIKDAIEGKKWTPVPFDWGEYR